MSTGLIPIIKLAAINVMENSQMCDLRYGMVKSTDPLTVQISSKFTIPQSLLVVPERLKKEEDKLKVGDKIALLRQQGGQSYFILDRI